MRRSNGASNPTHIRERTPPRLHPRKPPRDPREQIHKLAVPRLNQRNTDHNGLTYDKQQKLRTAVAVLALQDAGLGWDGEMRHLPSVGVPTNGTATEPYRIVKQDDDGDTFVVSSNTLAWAEAGSSRLKDVRPRRIGAFTHPTAKEIREAIGDNLPPRPYHSEWDNNAF